MYEGPSPFELAPIRNAPNPVLTAHDVTGIPAEFVADPFMIRHENAWYLFCEVWNNASEHGDIGLATSADGTSWDYEQIVLDEPFHLSYPFVFQYDDAYYMIPETYETESVRLYRADPFPTAWRFEQELISGRPYLDTTLFDYDGKLWLFTGLGNDTLLLFGAPELNGPWTEHPASPLIENDPRTARPAGAVFRYDGRIFRPAQNCRPTYGRQTRLFEIETLTESEYSEHEAKQSPLFAATHIGWNARGMHHLDLHRQPDGQWLAAVDGRGTTWCIGNHRFGPPVLFG